MKNIQRSKVILGGAFPLFVSEIAEHGDRELHLHDFHELVFVTGGRALHFTESEEYPVRKGDVFLVPPLRRHGYRDSRELSLVNLLFQPERMRLPLWDLPETPGWQLLFNPEPEGENTLRRHLHLDEDTLAGVLNKVDALRDAAADRQPGHRFRTVTLFMDLLSHLTGYFSSAETVRQEHRGAFNFEQILNFLELNYARKLTIRELGKRFFLSDSKLYRNFMLRTGRSPQRFLIDVRLSHAKNMLLNTELPVTAVADACGFYDSNHFARVFRERCGMTPGAYRRQKSGE